MCGRFSSEWKFFCTFGKLKNEGNEILFPSLNEISLLTMRKMKKKQCYFTFLSFSLSSMENDFQLSTPKEFTKLNKSCQTCPITRALSCGSTTLHPEHIKIGTYFMWTVLSIFFPHAVFSSHPNRCREKLREVLTFVTRMWIQAVLPIKGKRKRKF